jgi:two-component system, chemotaxis family, chemotaxis protein CheY
MSSVGGGDGNPKMTGKVLVIDDSMTARREIARAVSTVGLAVVEASDGVDGLLKLTANPTVRLIVCDVNMPRMNGIEFLEELNASGLRVPLLMLTTQSQPELIHRARALGAKGWIVKPFRPEVLAAAVKKLLEPHVTQKA